MDFLEAFSHLFPLLYPDLLQDWESMAFLESTRLTLQGLAL